MTCVFDHSLNYTYHFCQRRNQDEPVGRNWKHREKLSEHQLLLLRRIKNIVLFILRGSHQINDALTLDDDALMTWLHTAHMEKMEKMVIVPENELNKFHRRQANLERFYSELKTLGDVLSLLEVADLLGVSHKAVNQRVKKNRLLAFKQNGIYIFPAFQFTDSGLVNGFEEVMSAFSENTHPVLRLGALNSEIWSEKGGITKTPIQILQGGATRDELEQIIRIVHLFGEHTAS